MRARRRTITAVDITDPQNPKIVARADLPQAHMRSNSLETVGDILAIAYQTQQPGLQPAGLRTVRHLDAGKPEAHQLFRPLRPVFARRPPTMVLPTARHPHEFGRRPISADATRTTTSSISAIDVRNPSKPHGDRPLVAARVREGDNVAPPVRHTGGPGYGLPAAQHQRLPGAAGPRVHGLYRRRHDHPRHRRQGQPEDGVALGLSPAQLRASPTR